MNPLVTGYFRTMLTIFSGIEITLISSLHSSRLMTGSAANAAFFRASGSRAVSIAVEEWENLPRSSICWPCRAG